VCTGFQRREYASVVPTNEEPVRLQVEEPPVTEKKGKDPAEYSSPPMPEKEVTATPDRSRPATEERSLFRELLDGLIPETEEPKPEPEAGATPSSLENTPARSPNSALADDGEPGLPDTNPDAQSGARPRTRKTKATVE